MEKKYQVTLWRSSDVEKDQGRDTNNFRLEFLWDKVIIFKLYIDVDQMIGNDGIQ